MLLEVSEAIATAAGAGVGAGVGVGVGVGVAVELVGEPLQRAASTAAPRIIKNRKGRDIQRWYVELDSMAVLFCTPRADEPHFERIVR
jgi:hypothetical protein